MAENDGNNGGDIFDIDAVGGVGTTAVHPDDLSGGGNGGGDSGTGDDFTFDPLRHISADKRNADGSFKRKRRKRGTGSGDARKPHQEKATAYSVSAVEGILMNIHGVLATVAKAPELELMQIEANTLAKALVDLQKLYPNTVFSPKLAAWVNLGMTSALIYGPRLYNIRIRLAGDNAKNVHETPAGGDAVHLGAFPFNQPGVQ